jgi:hypothetical protein
MIVETFIFLKTGYFSKIGNFGVAFSINYIFILGF